MMIGLGTTLGLLYGWVINPVEYVNATPEELRSDYKTDYVLMTAEIYQADGDLEQAIRRLAALSEPSPAEAAAPAALSAAESALVNARVLEYPPADIATLTRLVEALQERSMLDTGGEGP